MKILLTIKERLYLQEILPRRGSLEQQIFVREILLSDEESACIGLKRFENRVTWDKSKDFEKEINLTLFKVEVLKNAIDVIVKSYQVTQENLDIILKINSLKS